VDARPIAPEDPRYADLVARGFNRRFVGRPDYVRVVGSTEQLIDAVETAVSEERRVAVRSGGHCLEGFVGDPCLSSADCAAGRSCERHGQGPGLCTQACDGAHACPTQNGIRTACVAGRCLKACDVQDACGAAVAATCAKAGTVLACLPSGG